MLIAPLFAQVSASPDTRFACARWHQHAACYSDLDLVPYRMTTPASSPFQSRETTRRPGSTCGLLFWPQRKHQRSKKTAGGVPCELQALSALHTAQVHQPGMQLVTYLCRTTIVSSSIKIPWEKNWLCGPVSQTLSRAPAPTCHKPCRLSKDLVSP